MADNKPYSARSAQPVTQPRMYSPDLQPLLQSLLGLWPTSTLNTSASATTSIAARWI